MKKILLIIGLFICSNVGAETQVEQAVRLFNQKEYPLAQSILEKESENGNAYATFWLGVTQYKNRQHFEAGQTFLKAAQMGSPWAMGVLAGGKFYANTPCSFLGWPCDKGQWEDKALAGWEKQSLAGNGKATYALKISKREWWEYIPFYRQSRYSELVPKAVSEGGYEFLEYSVYWKSLDKQVSIKTAANQGYAPAMVSLYYSLVENDLVQADIWINKAIDLGYAKAAQTKYFTYSLGRKNIEPDVKKAYYYNRLSGALGGDEDPANTITQENVVDEYGYPISDEEGNAVMRVLITPEEQAKLDSQVIERIKDIKPNMFLDETSIDLF